MAPFTEACKTDGGGEVLHINLTVDQVIGGYKHIDIFSNMVIDINESNGLIAAETDVSSNWQSAVSCIAHEVEGGKSERLLAQVGASARVLATAWIWLTMLLQVRCPLNHHFWQERTNAGDEATSAVLKKQKTSSASHDVTHPSLDRGSQSPLLANESTTVSFVKPDSHYDTQAMPREEAALKPSYATQIPQHETEGSQSMVGKEDKGGAVGAGGAVTISSIGHSSDLNAANSYLNELTKQLNAANHTRDIQRRQLKSLKKILGETRRVLQDSTRPLKLRDSRQNSGKSIR